MEVASVTGIQIYQLINTRDLWQIGINIYKLPAAKFVLKKFRKCKMSKLHMN